MDGPKPSHLRLNSRISRDPTAHKLYLALFRRASAPYAAMLERWTTTGHLKDPYEEFMVKESKDINRGIIDMDYIDDYWERRYTVRRSTSCDSCDSCDLLNGVLAPLASGWLQCIGL